MTTLLLGVLVLLFPFAAAAEASVIQLECEARFIDSRDQRVFTRTFNVDLDAKSAELVRIKNSLGDVFEVGNIFSGPSLTISPTVILMRRVEVHGSYTSTTVHQVGREDLSYIQSYASKIGNSVKPLEPNATGKCVLSTKKRRVF